MGTILGKAGFQSAIIIFAWMTILNAAPATAAIFEFNNLTDRVGGPGQGAAPSINIAGDVAFHLDSAVFFYDRSTDSFLEITALAGSPSGGWFPRLNDTGNIVFINPSTRHIWLYEADGAVFTDLASLPGSPGTTQLHDLYGAFDGNNSDLIVLHAGDLNYGDIHLYDHMTGLFSMVTDMPGGSYHGRDCLINNNGQVSYNGYPDTYVYDSTDGTTINITDLPGGPGTGSPAAMLNDPGDIAIFSGSELVYFNAANQSFWYLSTLPGFPSSSVTTNRNCLADNGSISFWGSEIFFFDPADSSFTQLTSQGTVPYSGHTSKINDNGEIAFEAGADIWLATPSPISAVSELPRGMALNQNSPNPFNPATLIRYEIPEDGMLVHLDIYDMRGKQIQTLVSARQAAGGHSAIWHGKDTGGRTMPSGTYIYRLQAGKMMTSRKMQLLR